MAGRCACRKTGPENDLAKLACKLIHAFHPVWIDYNTFFLAICSYVMIEAYWSFEVIYLHGNSSCRLEALPLLPLRTKSKESSLCLLLLRQQIALKHLQLSSTYVSIFSPSTQLRRLSWNQMNQGFSCHWESCSFALTSPALGFQRASTFLWVGASTALWIIWQRVKTCWYLLSILSLWPRSPRSFLHPSQGTKHDLSPPTRVLYGS